MIDDGGSNYAVVSGSKWTKDESGNRVESRFETTQGASSLRVIATAAMEAFIKTYPGSNYQKIADLSYDMALAMLAREREIVGEK